LRAGHDAGDVGVLAWRRVPLLLFLLLAALGLRSVLRLLAFEPREFLASLVGALSRHRRSSESAAAASAPAATASATTAAGPTLLRLVHAERTAVEHRAVELLDCGPGGLIRSHRDEREPARLAGLAVRRDGYLAHLTDCGESGFDRLARGAEREVS